MIFARLFITHCFIWISWSQLQLPTIVGSRGAKLNIRGDKVTGNIGIPGTGISYRQSLDNPEGTEKTAHAEPIQEPHQSPVEDEVPNRELSWKVFGLISFAGLVYVTYSLDVQSLC